MTQEEKDLLIKDLSCRLPYGVKVHAKYTDLGETIELDGIVKMIDADDVVGIEVMYDISSSFICVDIDNVKPYLVPLSSMTEEQAKELSILYGIKDILSIKITDEYIDFEVDDGFCSTEVKTIWYNEIISSIETFDWLNKNHFDYRGLIPMDLVIEAPEGMYN